MKYKLYHNYRGADKSLVRPGRKHVTATEDFDFRIIIIIGGVLVLTYLLHGAESHLKS